MTLKKRKFFLLIFLSSSLFFTFLPKGGFCRVLNIYEAKDSVIEFHKSGKYLKNIANQVKAAKGFITKRLKKAGPNEKLAIVFDIGDTLISQYDYALKTDFSQLEKPLIAEMELADFPAIKTMLDLYNFAKEKGLYIFLVTGRHPEMKVPTLKNITRDGYNNWTELYFDTPDRIHPTAQAFKTAMREKIILDGYTIIVNIGDQYSDLKGGYAEKTYKLPNHIYYVK